MDFYKKTDEIITLLSHANEMLAVKQVINGRSMSLMPGEALSIICSILRAYEVGQPELFSLIKEPAEELLQYAKSLGRSPVANFYLLEELSKGPLHNISMNFLSLIDHLNTVQEAESFLARELPNIEFDLVDIYLKDSLNLESEVFLFNAEQIANESLIEVEGIKLINLFPLNLTQEMVEEYSKLPDKLANAEIAEKIIQYRLKDA